MDHKRRVQEIMDAMSHGRVGPLFDAMAEDVTWRWMGVSQWSRRFEGKQLVMDTLFGGASSVETRPGLGIAERMLSLPFLNTAPARTSAARWGC
jgi:hypothetical protein